MDGALTNMRQREEPDDAVPVFRGGSTEQKDTFLGERLGRTRVWSTAFHAAMRIASEHLASPAPIIIDADEEAASLEAIVAGVLPCASMTIFRGNLYAVRRHQVGRPLTEDEVERIDQFAQQRWAVLHGVAA